VKEWPVMPIPTTPLTKRLMRWLSHRQPAPLDLDHPAMIDIAEAIDELEMLYAKVARMTARFQERRTSTMCTDEH
jgi:hypothetical protein